MRVCLNLKRDNSYIIFTFFRVNIVYEFMRIFLFYFIKLLKKMLYLVIQTDYSNYKGGDRQIIKGVYDNFNDADKLARKIYEEIKDYYKTDWKYDILNKWRYELFLQSDNGGQELMNSFKVIELEYELNSECEIEI